MRSPRHPRINRAALAVGLALMAGVSTSADETAFRAGASAVDITPTTFPVIVNGQFLSRTADQAHDPLHSRCLALDDGETQVVIVVVDSCVLPRDLIDRVKDQASRQTGIPSDRMVISATHTHSAPSAMACLGTPVDPNYVEFLPPRIVEGIVQAVANLEPARVGWAVIDDAEHTHNRRWIFRPDRMGTDPFGDRSIRANMHPGYQNPDAIGPSGPVDPELSVLSVQSADGRPIAVLANYSMHYYGAPALSADYYGRFAEMIQQRIGAEDPGAGSPFVGIMSQGTSGDLMWMNYGQPQRDIGLDAYAEAITDKAFEAYQTITYRDQVPLAMAETTLTLRRRVPDEARLAWARAIVAEMGDRLPENLPEVYAHEAIALHDDPERELKLQAIRIGELGITAIPNEVYAITGLKLKAQSPLTPTFNIELANGSEGYIPPPEQHVLGGYTTWPARTAALEVEAEPKIVATLLGLLEEVAGQPRRDPTEPDGPAAQAILDAKPVAFWRMGELQGRRARDATGQGHDGSYEDGVAFYLPGPDSPQFCGPGVINRAAHFAGGRMTATIPDVGPTYSAALWFWSGLPNEARPVTGYLVSRGEDGAEGAPGDHLGIGGTHTATGRLLFSNGHARNEVLAGRTAITPRTWNHVVLVRDGPRVRVHLNGQVEPEIVGEAAVAEPSGASSWFIGGRSDHVANFEGKIDEVAVFDRALSPQDVAHLFQVSGVGTDTSE